MLRICISGLTGSGKTTLGEQLAKDLKVLHVTKELTEGYAAFKKERAALGKGAALIETATKRYAGGFDREIAELARQNNCVVSTWLGPWTVKNPTLRVWLNASFKERARRKALQKRISEKSAERYVRLKDRSTIDSFKKIYGIDVMDHSMFDIELNTERLSSKERIAIIALLVAMRGRHKFK
ncbi:MAG: AAA family ATPase [Candidatus Micrarchaeia archaeon]